MSGDIGAGRGACPSGPCLGRVWEGEAGPGTAGPRGPEAGGRVKLRVDLEPENGRDFLRAQGRVGEGEGKTPEREGCERRKGGGLGGRRRCPPGG